MIRVRVSIDEEAFRQLVAGKIATLKGVSTSAAAGREDIHVELALQDIGFDRIYEAVNEETLSRVRKVLNRGTSQKP